MSVVKFSSFLEFDKDVIFQKYSKRPFLDFTQRLLQDPNLYEDKRSCFKRSIIT